MTEPTKRGPGRPRKNVLDHATFSNVTERAVELFSNVTERAVEPAAEPIPPGPLVLEVRLGPPGQGKIIFSQRVYAHTIDQQAHQAVITGALHPTTQ